MILIINQFSTQVFADVANAFREREDEVRYLTGTAEVGKLKIDPGVKVVGSVSYNRSNLVTRFATWLLFTFHVTFYMITTSRPSAVVVVTNPPLTPWIVSVIAKWRGIPFYLVVFDLYPDVLLQAGILKAGNPVYRLWQKLNHSVFARARKIFTLSESMREATAAYVDGAGDKILVVHNWAHTAVVTSVNGQDNPFRREHNLFGKLVVLYAGNMGFTHDLESLMEAAVLLKGNDDIRFVFMGDGAKKKKLEGMRDQHGLGNVLFLPYMTGEPFMRALGSCDIGVVTLGRGAEGISVPSKTYVNMAAGLGLLAIAPLESELARIIRHYDAGLMVEPNNPQKVAESILHLYRDAETLNRFKARAREASLQYTPKNAYKYVEGVMGKG